jgi:hypothetical protein
VDAEGEILNVGARTFKSVTGYDLARLFTGSWGTLGFLSEITLRLIPSRKRKDYSNVMVHSPTMDKVVGVKESKAALSLKIKRSLDPRGVFVGLESFA